MKIRLQADADLKHAIISGTLRRVPSMDFRRAETVPLEGLDDRAVLTKAANDGRIIVSHDVNTMEWHSREFTSHQISPGLILIPQKRVSVGNAMEGLVLLYEVLERDDFVNHVCLFPSLVIY